MLGPVGPACVLRHAQPRVDGDAAGRRPPANELDHLVGAAGCAQGTREADAERMPRNDFGGGCV
eukprot:5485620-Pleurochrysis_carterae.AAC.1